MPATLDDAALYRDLLRRALDRLRTGGGDPRLAAELAAALRSDTPGARLLAELDLLRDLAASLLDPTPDQQLLMARVEGVRCSLQ